MRFQTILVLTAVTHASIGTAIVDMADASLYLALSLSQSTDPYDNVGQAHAGLDTVYVCVHEHATTEVEFGLGGTYDIVSIVPAIGVVNLGTKTQLHLVPDLGLSCLPEVPVSVVVSEAAGTGAELCLEVTEDSGRLCAKVPSMDEWYRFDQAIGFTTIDNGPCLATDVVVPCTTLPVEPTSWGRMKALYR